jgi:hypothetical protein
VIKAVYRDGRVELLDPVPADWEEGLELEVGLSEEQPPLDDESFEQWQADMAAATAGLIEEDHDGLVQAIEEHERESKELGRREMERAANLFLDEREDGPKKSA